jgi:hypothetical protein
VNQLLIGTVPLNGPEPASLTLTGFGLTVAGFVFARRRRKTA